MNIENILTMQFVAIGKYLFKFGIIENRKTLLEVEAFPLGFLVSQGLYSHQNSAFILVNPFDPNIPFLYPLKTPENLETWKQGENIAEIQVIPSNLFITSYRIIVSSIAKNKTSSKFLLQESRLQENNLSSG